MYKIGIKNFKCFREQRDIDFSDITINVGINSVGKSTFIQSILLMRQSYDEMIKFRGTNETDFLVRLNGPYDLQIGTYNQVVSSNTENICFSINNFSMEYGQGRDEFSLLYHKENSVEDLPDCSIFSSDFHYINAERLGPRNYQNIGDYGTSLCGYHGENTFEILDKYGNDLVPDKKKRSGEDFTVNILSKQVQYWMDYIIPGVEFNPGRDVDTRTAKLKIRQTTHDTDFNSPYNFGFGISYLLPIIVTGLLAKENSVMIIENPEAHLHPSGQSKIGYFLAQMAAAGLKVVVETHSEHVVNGIRIYALKTGFPAEKICINYFSAGEVSPQIERIPLSDKMDIMAWPEGFFDQEEKDLCELRHLRRNK